ncbi:MAG: ATP-binding protein [Candidatus Odinarchaeota archaeon]
MVEKSLPVADRYKLRQFTKNINGKFDVAIVELLKNSDDSLKRIEQVRELKDFEKNIKIICKRRKSLIVVDNAEGMSQERLLNIIRYGEETSERDSVDTVSGLFGIGLKDAIYGLGAGKFKKVKHRIDCGEVITAKDNKWFILRFFISLEEGYERVKYVLPQEYKPTSEDLKLILDGHGTIVKIYPNNVIYPTHLKLKNDLISHIRLRDLFTNPNRNVELYDQNKNYSDKLVWIQTWKSEEKLYDKEIQITGFSGGKIHLTIHRANRDLNVISYMQSERGILIRSRGDIHESTLFDYNNNTYTKTFYGELYTDYIDKLVRDREEILEQSRTGLNHHHEFYIKLKRKVNDILANLIQKERERVRGKSRINKKTKKSLKSLAVILREIGAEELKEEEALIGPNPITPLSKPPDFGFIKRYRKIYVNVESIIIFYARVPEFLNLGDYVEFSMDNPEIEIDILGCAVEESLIENNILRVPIVVKGLKENIEGNLTAKYKEHISAIRIKVIKRPGLNEFGFAQNKYSGKISSSMNLTFSAKIDHIVEVGDPVSFSSNATTIIIQTSEAIIEDNQNGYFITTVTITIRNDAEIGDIWKLKAECSGKEHIAFIEIIEEQPKISFPEPAIDDKKEDPEYPVELSIRENRIWVYALHRTVKPFWDSEKQTDDINFKIRFADLIVEETINYLVGRKLGNIETYDWFTSESLKRYIYKNHAHKIYQTLGLIM